MVRRALMALGAVALIVLGGALLAGAAGLYSAFGWHGSISRDLGIVTPTAESPALLIDVDKVTFDSDWPVPGQASLAATSDDARLVMVAGDPATADALLQGAAYSVAMQSDDGWTTVEVPGGPMSSAGSALEWSARTTDASQGMDLPLPTTVVLFTEDGHDLGPVALTLRWQIAEPRFAIAAFGFVGLMLVVGGGALLYAAAAVRFRRD